MLLSGSLSVPQGSQRGLFLLRVASILVLSNICHLAPLECHFFGAKHDQWFSLYLNDPSWNVTLPSKIISPIDSDSPSGPERSVMIVPAIGLV